MKFTTKITVAIILTINILLRIIYILYGYIPSEEGMLIYGQKLAYSGLLPFIDYNAWNSLLNNYLVGWYQFFITPTILTQRIFALILSSIVFFLVLYICKSLKRNINLPLVALLLTFGSFTYLYYSTIPTSEQTMTLSLIISLALISKTLNTTKHHLLSFTFSFLFAVLAFPIRPQALPAIFIIWIYIASYYRKNIHKLFIVTTAGIIFLFCIYLPFILNGWDNFIYSITWPFKAQEILVYQARVTHFELRSLVPFTINALKEYSVLFIVLGAIILWKLRTYKTTINEILQEDTHRFIFFSFLSALVIAGASIVHKPPYSTYIYPAVPIFSYVAGFYISSLLESIKPIQYQEIKTLLYGIILFLALQSFIVFPHSDYMNTSLAIISKPPYFLLKEIQTYIESKTSPGSEVVSFYLPAVAQLNRIIPKNLNEGEGSMSILSTEKARKYHLTNVEMLKEYIALQQAVAIIMVDITPNFFGITQKDRNETLEVLNSYYFLDKTFSNFSMIGNPRVSHLYIYLRKNVP